MTQTLSDGTVIRITTASASARTNVGELRKIVALFVFPEELAKGGRVMYRVAASRSTVGGNPQWMKAGPLVHPNDFEVV